MPLIVEDGTGIANADSYVSEPDTTAYFADRSVEAWGAATVLEREAALRVAADYLTYAYRWPGQPATVDQRLPWPRSGVRSGAGYYPSNGIPTQLVDAQMVLAVEALTTPLLQKPTAADRQIIEETKSAKGFSKSLKYATSPVDSVSGLRRFAVPDNILRGVALGGVGGDFAIVPLAKRW